MRVVSPQQMGVNLKAGSVQGTDAKSRVVSTQQTGVNPRANSAQ